MFYGGTRIKQGISYRSFCRYRILYNSKFILMARSLGTNAVVVKRVHCSTFLSFYFVTNNIVSVAGRSVDCCIVTFYTWDEETYHLLEDFGVCLEAKDFLLFGIMACNDARLLLMKDREDFVDHVYKINLGISILM